MPELKRRFWALFEQHHMDFYPERRAFAVRWMERARDRMDMGEDEQAAVDAALELVRQGVEVVDTRS